MRPETALAILERILDAAVTEMQSKVPVRTVESMNHVPSSTSFDRLKAVRSGRHRSRRGKTLTDSEERQVAAFAASWADLGVPLTRNHLIEATAEYIEQLPFSRRRNLPFKDGKPG